MEEIKKFVLEVICEGVSTPQEIIVKIKARFPNEDAGRVFGIVRNQLKKEGLIINASRGLWTVVVNAEVPSSDF